MGRVWTLESLHGPVQSKEEAQRRLQAAACFRRGHYGDELSMNWDAYLASIPSVPPFPQLYNYTRCNRLVLVDRRVSVEQLCRRLEVEPGIPGVELVSKHTTLPEVYWMWCQDGRCHLRLRPMDAEDFRPIQVGCDLHEGLAILLQDPNVLEKHDMDLPGTMVVGKRCAVTGLARWQERVRVVFLEVDRGTHPRCGFASRLRLA